MNFSSIGGLSGVGSIMSGLGSIAGLFTGSSTRAWQEQMMQKQMDFQSEEAEKQRTWSSEEAETARDWNSIVNQLQRAREAGVNPYSLVATGNYGSATGAVAPQGAMASGGMNVPTPSTAYESLGADLFNSVAQAIDHLANAQNKGIDTTFLRKTLDDRIASISEDLTNKQLVNFYQSVRNQYVDKFSEKQLEQMDAAIYEMTASGDLSYERFNEVKSIVERNLSAAGLDRAQRDQLVRYLDNYFDDRQRAEINKIQAETVTEGAKQYNLTQAGELAGQQSLTEENKRALMDAQTEWQKIANQVRSANVTQEIATNLEELTQRYQQAGILTSQMQEQLLLLIKERKWYNVTKVFETIESWTRSTENATASLENLSSALSKWLSLSPAKIKGFSSYGK